MKRILAIFLALVLLSGVACAEGEAKAAPGDLLGFRLMRELCAEGGNVVISPDSLALALGMAAEGAKGDTLAQLLELLGAEDLQGLGHVPEGIRSANAGFVQPGLELNADYIAALAEKYGPEWFELGPDAMEQVNAWVEEHTDGLIERLLSQPLPVEAGLVLVNAVAMDAKWALPFASEASGREIFHAPDGDVEVDMMHQTDDFIYGERDGVQMLRLPYEEGELGMWILLPEAGGMDALLDALAEEGSAFFTGAERYAEVRLSLPKFDVSDDNSLSGLLRAMGAELPFSLNADFSGMSDTPLHIYDILQKARVQVDEDGTRAAAATALVMCTMAAPGSRPEPVEMRVDRPFVFVIADAARGNVSFAGMIENPVAQPIV